MSVGTPPKKAVETCLVLVTLRRQGVDEVLLGLKKRGFGEGRIVAPGGKIDAGETPHEAAVRELHEETGLRALTLDPVGVLDFAFPDDPQTPDLTAHVFVTSRVEGAAASSDELDVVWVPVDSVPHPRMWPDAAHWLPRALAHDLRHAQFVYAGSGDRLVSASLA